ncbi:hypothetical protein FKM82_019587 [Ascaphus truei]
MATSSPSTTRLGSMAPFTSVYPPGVLLSQQGLISGYYLLFICAVVLGEGVGPAAERRRSRPSSRPQAAAAGAPQTPQGGPVPDRRRLPVNPGFTRHSESHRLSPSVPQLGLSFAGGRRGSPVPEAGARRGSPTLLSGPPESATLEPSKSP